MLTFVKTRWWYDSYTDFWSLVNLSGYPTCFVDEMDLGQSENTYIVTPMNGEFRPFIDEYKAKNTINADVFLWNLERPGYGGSLSDFIETNKALVESGYIKAAIHSDRIMCQQDSCFHYVPLGGHKLLGEPGCYEGKQYDLIHLSCYSNYRGWMFEIPERPRPSLWGCSVAPNDWGETRHHLLQKSRYMLNIHQDGFSFIEPLRWVLAAAYGLPIITEFCHDTHPCSNYVYGNITFGLSLNGDIVREMVRNYSLSPSIYHHGLAFRDYMTGEFSFQKCLETYL